MTIAHPDDEMLSALLDGEADQDADTHVAGCAACGARLAALRAAAASVGEAPQPRPAVRESAIRAALMESAGAHPVSRQSSRPTRQHPYGGRRSLATVGWVAAAAAVVALFVALPALLAGGGNSMKASSAARATTATTTALSPAPGGALPRSTNSAAGDVHGAYAYGPTAPANDSVLAPPDLGAQDDPAALAHQLDTIVTGQSSYSTSPELTPSTTPGAQAAGQAGKTTTPATAPAGLRCAGVAAGLTGAGPGAKLDFGARLRWRGTPAEVYVFSAAQHRYAGVMSLSSCQLLQSLAV
jgi:hypothetical protein